MLILLRCAACAGVFITADIDPGSDYEWSAECEGRNSHEANAAPEREQPLAVLPKLIDNRPVDHEQSDKDDGVHCIFLGVIEHRCPDDTSRESLSEATSIKEPVKKQYEERYQPRG